MNITDKTGNLIAIKQVQDGDDLMIINKSGLTIRMEVSDLRVMGRATQGVRLINLKGKDQIAAVAKVDVEFRDENEGAEGEEGLDGVEGETPAIEANQAPDTESAASDDAGAADADSGDQ